MSREPFYRLRAAAVDGRAGCVFYRREQLRKLRDGLLAARTELCETLAIDSGTTATEAWIELYLALSALKTYYEDLDPAKATEREYRIARGEDAPDAKMGVGIAYIQPTTHTLVFSVIVPICAAIAAGNCVIVLLQQHTPRKTLGVLQKLLWSSIDHDLIEIVSDKVEDEEFLKRCVKVIQQGDFQLGSHNILFSPAKALVVGIVDRSADVSDAARALVNARFSFGGTSPYAPDIVLVHEFVKADFLNAVVQQSVRYSTEESESGNDMSKIGASKSLKISPSVGINVVISMSNISILDSTQRNSLQAIQKLDRKALCVHPVTSVDDAIDVASSLSCEQLLATYAFGSREACKYMIQFVGPRLAFSNHIPVELLVGPAAPHSLPASPRMRYPVEAFTTPNPAYASTSTLERDLEELLLETSMHKLVQKEMTLLKGLELTKDRPVRLLTGFFEQGIITGLATMGAPTLFVTGIMVYYSLSRLVLPMLRR